MKHKSFARLLLLTITLCCVLSISAQNFTVRQIMAEPSMAGMRPESERLSPNGKYVIYAWNEENKEPRNLYIWDGQTSRILLKPLDTYETRPQPPESKLNYGLTVRDEFSRQREGSIGGIDFSPDSKRILFSQNTDIYVLDLETEGAKPRRITRTQGLEGGARWLTNDSILYSSSGNYFVLDLKETTLIQVTREANPTSFISIFGANASNDGKLLAYTVSDGSKQRVLYVPNYLGEFVQPSSTRRGFTTQRVFVSKTDGSLTRPFEAKLPAAEGVSMIRSVKWAADNTSLVIDRVDKDLKRRQLFYVQNIGSKEEKVILVTEETDNKWIASLSRIVEPNPKDASQVFFGSERDGFNHLYLATLKANNFETKQLTKGNFEVDWAKWNAKGEQMIFSSTEENTAERQFYVFDKQSNQKTMIHSGEKGMRNTPQLDDINEQPTLIYKLSTWNQPSELYSVKVCANCSEKPVPQQITNSIPEDFKQIKWNEPKFIDIPTRDGKVVKSKIYLPKDFSASTARSQTNVSRNTRQAQTQAKPKSYPMVIFVHGAGYLQNTINGWNNYYREFMFNQILTEKGYVVLDIDFRGSAGYGRDWRTDVHDFLGGKDFDDHIDAIDYMVKNYAVDVNKIGAYGGSYGGFMAGMLVMRAPDKIAAAAALRPVFDWKNYFASSPIYTLERLGFPDKNPEAYKRSSPIAYAEQLQKPLLILHGLVDDNVPAQDSIQLIEKLMRLEKTQYFDAMLYPSENHGFTRPSSWTDEYERILSLFEKHLK